MRPVLQMQEMLKQEIAAIKAAPVSDRPERGADRDFRMAGLPCDAWLKALNADIRRTVRAAQPG
jgi:hypothetical protein